MIFEGRHVRPVSPQGSIALPPEWVPADGRFCAFVAPRSRPLSIALHPAALAETMRESLTAANQQTGLSMTLHMVDVRDGHLLLPSGLRQETVLGDMAVLVGKGCHVLIHEHRGNETLVSLPPMVPKQ